MTGEPRPARWPIVLSATALALAVCAVFFPIVTFSFVDFDVGAHVIQNDAIKGLNWEHLKRIFTSKCINSYYPIRTLTYAIDYQFWTLTPGGFKLTNGLIHIANTMLVFWLILRLFRISAASHSPRPAWWNLFVATASAGIFALHPVVVEPVAWIPGREELLMTLGALGCIHFHMSARRSEGQPGSKRTTLLLYVGAALCCVAASLSNAVAAIIPLLIVAWDVVFLPRPKVRRILYGTSGLWVVAVATIMTKRFTEGGWPAMPVPVSTFTARWVMVILNVYWLNLKTLFRPTKLCLHYDWIYPQSFLQLEVVLGGVAVILSVAVLWIVRRQRLVLFGLLWFGFALGPTSEVLPHHILRADRFLYLPLVGLAVAVAMGLRPLGQLLTSRVRAAAPVAVSLLGLLLLGARSANQVQTWRDSLSAWEQSLTVDPHNARAHDAFADNLVNDGRFDLAIPHYEKVLQILPCVPETLDNYAKELAINENEKLRDYRRAIELAERACTVTGWKKPGLRKTLARVRSCYAADQQEKGNFGQAIDYYWRALQAEPSYSLGAFNLALLLATCPDERLRRPEEAVALAEEACRQIGQPDLNGLNILATTYAQAGQFTLAAITTKKAFRLAQASGYSELAEQFRRQVQLYENSPLPHDSP